MPIFYQIDDARQRMYTRCEGIINFQDLRRHMNAEESSPAASYSEIFDCSDAEIDISDEEIHQLAAERELVAEHREAAPFAVVAINRQMFEKLHLYDMLTEQIRPMQVFHNIEAAERWLDEVARRWGNI